MRGALVAVGIVATALWLIRRDGELGRLAAPETDQGAIELDVRAGTRPGARAGRGRDKGAARAADAEDVEHDAHREAADEEADAADEEADQAADEADAQEVDQAADQAARRQTVGDLAPHAPRRSTSAMDQRVKEPGGPHCGPARDPMRRRVRLNIDSFVPARPSRRR